METRYKVNFRRLAEQNLPPDLRSRSILALMRSAFAPVQSSKVSGNFVKRFAAFRDDTRFDISHNGQVCYLRAALNAKFKSNLGVFFDITDTVKNLEWVYAMTEDVADSGEGDAAPAGTKHIFAKIEQDNDPIIDPLLVPNEAILEGHNTFIVWVPADLYATKLPQIKQFVNKYRLVTRVPQYEPKNS